jgi:alpha-beta hydrolase superfamily lysophospholipase
MEKDLRINLDKKHVVYGRLRGSLKRPLFMTVHGLPGDFREGLHEQAARWFAKRGFAAFRFNLYDWQKHARQLTDCTLQTHANDLDAVIRYFRRRGVKKIFVAGHSYGGPAILLSREQDFNAAALWDPSFKIFFTKKCYGYPAGTYVKALNGYVMKWGVDVIIGKAMAEEANRLPWTELTKNFHAPLKIISAEKGVLVPGAKQYFKTANAPKSLTVLKGATHYFDDKDGMRENVFKISKQWFDAF